jgi:DNA-binding response OmpR family regulator
VQSTTEQPTILVVEDEKAIRELLRLHLENAGYQLLLAEDAIAGGRMLLEKRPSLLIVDAGLPYLSGVDFVATLIADYTAPALPIIFITGRDDLVARAEALGDACLKKPFYADQLLALVARFLRPDQASAGVRSSSMPHAA